MRKFKNQVHGLRFLQVLLTILASMMWTSGCAALEEPAQPGLIPTEQLPTAIALTLEARGIKPGAPTASRPPSTGAGAEPASTRQPTASSLPETPFDPQISPSPVPPTSSSTIDPTTLALPPVQFSPTFAPPLPDATVQIYRIGEMSRIISPLQVTTHLTSEWGKVVRIELFGEDGRLLARDLRTFHNVPWDAARVDTTLEFGISAAGEAGRLVISVEDPNGRLIDVNSVNLILLSQGETQLNPATALWQRLIIQEPSPKELILGGKLIASGRALLDRPDQPLRVMLVGEDGKILGQRLARAEVKTPGDYGDFIAEVPYTVAELTPARLVVFEEGEPISDISHLASIEVMLAP